jgi:hypothetical protein
MGTDLGEFNNQSIRFMMRQHVWRLADEHNPVYVKRPYRSKGKSVMSYDEQITAFISHGNQHPDSCWERAQSSVAIYSKEIEKAIADEVKKRNNFDVRFFDDLENDDDFNEQVQRMREQEEIEARLKELEEMENLEEHESIEAAEEEEMMDSTAPALWIPERQKHVPKKEEVFAQRFLCTRVSGVRGKSYYT